VLLSWKDLNAVVPEGSTRRARARSLEPNGWSAATKVVSIVPLPTVADVARGLGVRPERVCRLLRQYGDAEIRGAENRFLLTERQGWGCVQIIGRHEGGLWYELSSDIP
jgi:hypothetical protein